jgi:hypothetical protein
LTWFLQLVTVDERNKKKLSSKLSNVPQITNFRKRETKRNASISPPTLDPVPTNTRLHKREIKRNTPKALQHSFQFL